MSALRPRVKIKNFIKSGIPRNTAKVLINMASTKRLMNTVKK
jgi:hypothetical protein